MRFLGALGRTVGAVLYLAGCVAMGLAIGAILVLLVLGLDR